MIAMSRMQRWRVSAQYPGAGLAPSAQLASTSAPAYRVSALRPLPSSRPAHKFRNLRNSDEIQLENKSRADPSLSTCLHLAYRSQSAFQHKSQMQFTISTSQPHVTPTKHSAAQFLRRLPDSPYTSLTVHKSKSVLYWNDHAHRLRQGLQKINGEELNTDQISDIVLPLLRASVDKEVSLQEKDVSAVVLIQNRQR